MRVDVVTEIVLELPAVLVANYVCEPENAPEWYVNIKAARWLGMPGLREGARAAFVAQFLGKRLECIYEIMEYVDHERLVMSTSEGPFPMTTEYHFYALGEERCRMVLRNHGEPAGFSKLVAPLIARAVRRANEKDLKKLKAILEA